MHSGPAIRSRAGNGTARPSARLTAATDPTVNACTS
jgi:hypothetical protein